MLVVWLLAAVFAAGQSPQMSEEVFKNIQVLKGMPVDEFMGTMGLFSAALSMCCGDCHTGAGTSNPRWEEDPPRKRTARRMIQMVDTINRTNFNGRHVVTCWTCHRGQPMPTGTPALDRIYGEPVTDPPDVLPAATSGVPTIDQILDKYVAAMGGAARLASVTSLIGVGLSLVEASDKEVVARATITAIASLSVILSWATVHTVFTLRYARLYWTGERGIDFNDDRLPTYGDFAYFAFTIGMTYQVSDTSISSRPIRRTALHHAYMSYLFGTVVVAMTINIVAGLFNR